jgi:alpha-tubulin suppressor-like RCC1 family protein
VEGGLRFVAISTGELHNCAIDDFGAAWCWGLNQNGQLGDGTFTNRLMPVAVMGGLRFNAIAAGAWHTCGVTTTGEVYCWGRNAEGELGTGVAGLDSATPLAAATSERFTKISAGSRHTCALTLAGSAYCWGSSPWGQLGTGSFTSTATPARVAGNLSFEAISAAVDHTCGLAANGAAYCWGEGHYGQLGNGKTEMRDPLPTRAQAGVLFSAVSAGYGFTCGIANSGAALCWGSNWWGQLGNRSFTNSTGVVAVSDAPEFVAVSTGSYHACGITSAGTAFCWGQNSFGQLGRSTFGYEMIPVPVRGFTAGVRSNAGRSWGR